jgi:hypothetical protein
MHSAIRSSVDQLTPATRQLFRRLALLQGPTFAADQAAAVVDEPRWRTADMLEELADLNLVHTAPGDRYAMDDLFRLYAEDELAAREPLTARVPVQANPERCTTPAHLPPVRDPARRASLNGRRRLVPRR